MENEYYGVASTPMDDYLAHYGIKGMKWGVRRAIQRGNERALSRQYRKAEKKRAKLEKRAASGKKYAKRAAKLGIGAAAAGGLAAAGTRGVWNAMGKTNVALKKVGKALSSDALQNVARSYHGPGGKIVRGAGQSIGKAASAVGKASTAAGSAVGKAGAAVGMWGSKKTGSEAVRKLLNSDAVQNLGRGYHGVGGQVVRGAGSTVGKGATALSNSLKGVSNNTLARIGAGAIGAGLAAGAARNAYKAATTKKAAKKAAQFRAEMNKTFAGTKYANGRPASQKKRRK